MNSVRNMLQIIHTSTRGGAEKHTRLISKAFANLGINVTIVYPPGAYANEFASLKNNGVNCIEFDIKKSIWKTVAFIRNLIKTQNIDTVHSHLHGADIIAVLACFGIKNVKFFSTIHFLPQNNPGLLHRFKSSLMTFISFHLAYKVFAVSEDVAQQARSDFFLSNKKVVSVLNSIDFDEMSVNKANVEKIRKKYAINPDDKLLVCAGSFVSRKGQQYIIQAIRYLISRGYPVKILFLGEGEDEQELKNLAYICGLENIAIFPGFTYNIPDWMSVADIYLQVSIIDPLPRAMLEAMYLGVPVVATNIASMSQVIKNEETGLTVDVRSVQQIVNAVERLLINEDFAKKLGRNGRDFIKSHCSMTTMAKTIIESLEKK